MQVIIFSGSHIDVQKYMNSWLSKNPTLQVHQVTQSDGPTEGFLVTVLYSFLPA
jgi:hypothetical protein